MTFLLEPKNAIYQFLPMYNIDDLTITDKEKEGVCKEPVNQG